MTAIDITFIVLSSILLLYLLFGVLGRRRIPLVVELAYLGTYVISALFFFFPSFWQWLNSNFGVQLLINLILVIAVFGLFALSVRFYQKLELLRKEITAVVREHALLQETEKKSKK